MPVLFSVSEGIIEFTLLLYTYFFNRLDLKKSTRILWVLTFTIEMPGNTTPILLCIDVTFVNSKTFFKIYGRTYILFITISTTNQIFNILAITIKITSNITFFICSFTDNISLRILFPLKTVQMEFSGNMFLRLLSECKIGRCFLIKLLILGNIGLYVVANKIWSLAWLFGLIFLASFLDKLEMSLKCCSTT